MQTALKSPSASRCISKAEQQLCPVLPVPAPLPSHGRGTSPAGSCHLQLKPQQTGSRPRSARRSRPIPCQPGAKETSRRLLYTPDNTKKAGWRLLAITKNSSARMAARGTGVICTNSTHLFGLKRLEYEQGLLKHENFKTSGSFQGLGPRKTGTLESLKTALK